MDQFKEFIANNFRIIFVVISFMMTIYIQHTTNTSQIATLSDKCTHLEIKIEDQYDKIDAIKLDKAVFEATITQFGAIQTDLREMRADIKELLKTQH